MGGFFILPAPKIEDGKGPSFFGPGRSKNPPSSKNPSPHHLRRSRTLSPSPSPVRSSTRSSGPKIKDGGSSISGARRWKTSHLRISEPEDRRTSPIFVFRSRRSKIRPIFVFRTRKSNTPPSSIFGAEDWVEDRHRPRGAAADRRKVDERIINETTIALCYC